MDASDQQVEPLAQKPLTIVNLLIILSERYGLKVSHNNVHNGRILSSSLLET